MTLIAALASNRVIGVDGRLPWRLPDDMKQFRRRTLGKPVVMGRKTWQSLRRPLADRRNIVLSRDPGFTADGAEVARSLEEALALARDGGADEALIIGGEAVYAAALPLADRLILTHVAAAVDGDARFPEFDPDAWRVSSEEAHDADARHAHAFRVTVYERA